MDKIYIVASSYQAAVIFCRNQEPEINPRGKNVRIITRADQTHGIVIHQRDKVHVVTANDEYLPYSLLQAWSIVETTSRSLE